MKQVYIKEQVCIGCHLCEVYCRLKHARSGDLVKPAVDAVMMTNLIERPEESLIGD